MRRDACGATIRPLVPRPVTCRARTRDFAVVGENFTRYVAHAPLCTNKTSTFHDADVVQVVRCEVDVSMPRDELRLALVR